MRITLVAAAGLAALALTACNKDSSADAHLKAAGDEAKSAVADVGKAIDSTTPQIKEAGAKLGDDIKKAGDDVKEAGDKAKDRARKDD